MIYRNFINEKLATIAIFGSLVAICGASVLLDKLEQKAYNSQHNAHFDNKMAKVNATLLSKNKVKGYGFLYLDIDNDGKADLMMRSWIGDKQKKQKFNELILGSTNSIHNLKQTFDSTTGAHQINKATTVFLSERFPRR